VCFGDLNDMLPGDEKIGGTPKSYDHLGRDVEVECGLSDLGFIFHRLPIHMDQWERRYQC
jgi:hypothetical protein